MCRRYYVEHTRERRSQFVAWSSDVKHTVPIRVEPGTKRCVREWALSFTSALFVNDPSQDMQSKMETEVARTWVAGTDWLG